MKKQRKHYTPEVKVAILGGSTKSGGVGDIVISSKAVWGEFPDGRRFDRNPTVQICAEGVIRQWIGINYTQART